MVTRVQWPARGPYPQPAFSFVRASTYAATVGDGISTERGIRTWRPSLTKGSHPSAPARTRPSGQGERQRGIHRQLAVREDLDGKPRRKGDKGEDAREHCWTAAEA
jgi:hypothetical protein